MKRVKSGSGPLPGETPLSRTRTREMPPAKGTAGSENCVRSRRCCDAERDMTSTVGGVIVDTHTSPL